MNSTSAARAADWGVEVVAIPDVPSTLEGLDVTLATLDRAGVSYRIDRHWTVAAQVRNVTNQKYINSLYWEQAYYGAPRHAQLTVNWSH